jgi:hypothetical protein
MHDHHNMHDMGFSWGWLLFALSQLGQWSAGHALPILNGLALAGGLGCQVYVTYLRHVERQETKAAREREATSKL